MSLLATNFFLYLGGPLGFVKREMSLICIYSSLGLSLINCQLVSLVLYFRDERGLSVGLRWGCLYSINFQIETVLERGKIFSI